MADGRSQDSFFHEPIIGIYDNKSIISSRLVESAPPNQILRFRPSGETHGPSLEQFLANKALFLETASDVIIVLMESKAYRSL
jgi:hypothetical protein